MAYYLPDFSTMDALTPIGRATFGVRLMQMLTKLKTDESAQLTSLDTDLKTIQDSAPAQAFPNGIDTTEADFADAVENEPNAFGEAFRMIMRAYVGEAPMRSAVADVGDIKLSARASAPTGWLLCDGAEISRTTYADLFDAIGTTYGVGDGVDTFNIPDLEGRVPVGRDAGQTEFDTLGESGGAKTHTLTAGEMPSHTHSTPAHQHNIAAHTHSVGDHQHGIPVDGAELDHVHSVTDRVAAGPEPTDGNTGTATTDPAGAQETSGTSLETDNDGSGTSGSAGGDGAHNNLQPYLVLNYFIKT